MTCPQEPLQNHSFDRLKWVTITDRVHYRKRIIIYKSLHGMASTYMKYMYTYVYNINTRRNRHSDDKSKLDLAP